MPLRHLNPAQKIAACATLLAIAVYLFVGGHGYRYTGPHYDFSTRQMSEATKWVTDWGATIADCVGILLVGAVATFLLGHIRARKKGDSGT